MDKPPSSAPGANIPALQLQADFPLPTYADWRKIVDAELKGAPFDKKLVTRTYEGIALQPIYRREDVANLPHATSMPGFAPFVRGTRASGYSTHTWDVSQEIFDASPSEFNTTARACAGRGLTGLNIVLDKATRNGQDPDVAIPGEVGAGGLSIAMVSDLAKAFEGIDLAKTSLFVRSGASGLPFAALLAALCGERGVPTSGLRGCIEMDPLGVLAHEGKLPQSLKCAYREMAELVRWSARNASDLQTICVHSRAWHDAGGNAVQELAFALSTAVEYLREMNARGLEVDTVAPQLRFAITVGSNFFMEIAKLRAARMLWSSAVASLGGKPDSQRLTIHVRTATWNKTALDPYVNLLRGTVEAFAGAMGGCDSMQVGAFDEVIRTPDEFSQRIARNTQLVLQKECDLDRVIDPAGGSWYVETLTDSVARGAWALFQQVEKLGGMAKAMAAGFPQGEVAKTASEKLKNVAMRRDVLVGTNQYANLKEKSLARPAGETSEFHRRRVQQVKDHRTTADDAQSSSVLGKLSQIVETRNADLFECCVAAARSGATVGEITRALRVSDTPDAPVKAVKLQRASEAFERLRGAVDCFVAGSGARPKIYLATLGPTPQHKARADFSRGFFALGGFDVVYPPGCDTAEDAAAKALASGAPIIVICSTDETYPALVPALVQAIKSKDKTRFVVLAGYPQDHVEAFKQAGVDDFVHVRVNAVDFLTNLLKKAGVPL